MPLIRSEVPGLVRVLEKAEHYHYFGRKREAYSIMLRLCNHIIHDPLEEEIENGEERPPTAYKEREENYARK